MSMQITEAFVQQYKANIFHLSQQKGSRLRMAVRSESQVGKRAYYERLGATAAIKKLSRHSDTPLVDSAHSRRAVTMEDFEWADLVDEQDKIRTLIDPTNPYAQAAAWAMGRSMDDVLIAAMRGNAFAGEEAGTIVALPLAQKLLAHTDAVPGTPTNLNVDTLRRAKGVLDAADVDPSIERYFALNSSALQSLLKETAVTSADFNTVKALVQGELDTFMGFKFIRLERLASESVFFDGVTGDILAAPGSTLANAKHMLAWAKDGVLLSVGKDMQGKIDPRVDKSYAMQVYACMSIGATRLEDAMVVDIACAQ